MDPTEVLSFFRLVERGYHTANPYHNALHACDVTQAMYVFCQQAAIQPHLTPLDLLAALVAAVGHDLDHPGVNEKFLLSTSSHLAVLYDNETSVLENHHWRSAVSCFVEAGLARYLTDGQLAEFIDLVRSLILATDISRQQEFLVQFRYVMDAAAGATADGLKDLAATPHHRHFLLQIAIKCADISNPCRAWPVSRLWSLRACEEFFRQGDRERDLGMPVVTPICDRFNVTVAKVQVGFYSFVVEPLFREWHRFLASGLSAAMLASFAANQKRWEAEVLNEDLSEASLEEVLDSAEEVVMTVTDLEEVNKTMLPGGAAAKAAAVGVLVTSCLDRRMSLPSSQREPLHRIFDQMLQPDATMTGSDGGGSGLGSSTGRAGGAVNLRRNFSLTDRRRSSLLRGLYTRSSLKPVGGNSGRAGRLSRPTSACLESTSESTAAAATATGRPGGHRTLQPMENRLEDSPSVAPPPTGMELSNFEEEQQQKLLAVIRKNFPPPPASDEDDMAVMLLTAEREKENTSSGSPFNLYQRLTQRRGSAPSNLVLGDSAKVNSGGGPSLLVRQQSSLAMSGGTSGGGNNRRGSLPSELLADSLPKQLRNRIHGTAGSSSSGTAGGGGGKGSKGLLRRRSMGPEMLNLNHHHPCGKERPLVQKYLNRPF
jgi:hypothetical protein